MVFEAFLKISPQKPDSRYFVPLSALGSAILPTGSCEKSKCDKNVIGPCSNSTKTIQIESSLDSRKCLTVQIYSKTLEVIQIGSLFSEARGRAFESPRARHKKSLIINALRFLRGPLYS
jgi:hypothetical protein